MKFKVIGENRLWKREYECKIPADLIDKFPDKDIVAFGRWINTKKPHLVLRATNRKSRCGLLFLSEEKVKEIVKWFYEKKKEAGKK